jgi:hypothetical protein
MRATANLITDLSTYEINPQRGCLPSNDPLDRLPTAFDAWEEVAHELPKLMVTEKLRARLGSQPPGGLPAAFDCHAMVPSVPARGATACAVLCVLRAR